LATETPTAVVALGRLIGAHAALTRELSAQLVADHGVTLNEYEVLLLLAHAPDRSMRRVDLATEVPLSPSGVTRMLDRHERAGLVEKGECPSDGRVTYAVLTEAGVAKLEECSRDHLAAAQRMLGARLDEDELASLSELLGRFTDVTDGDCEPPS
jgi:MarR family transcriptional regulator, 2-MHQ and catechol-resistance regulon repressor